MSPQNETQNSFNSEGDKEILVMGVYRKHEIGMEQNGLVEGHVHIEIERTIKRRKNEWKWEGKVRG